MLSLYSTKRSFPRLQIAVDFHLFGFDAYDRRFADQGVASGIVRGVLNPASVLDSFSISPL
jgi:hypothetical protein